MGVASRRVAHLLLDGQVRQALLAPPSVIIEPRPGSGNPVVESRDDAGQAPGMGIAGLETTSSLAGKTLFITGATRGIGLSIALRAAREGANIAVVGKTREPHPHLPGTLDSACEAIEAAGGQAIPLCCDIREEDQVERAVEQTVQRFSGIDILVNNASAISLVPTAQTTMKRFDLMNGVNARGTFLCGLKCLPHLLTSGNPHILTLSPPLTLKPAYFGPHLAYSMAKFGMSLCTLGWAEEFAGRIGVNSLWPRTVIDTAAVRNLLGGVETTRRARHPAVVADAARWILGQSSATYSGQFLLDEDVLRQTGVTDFTVYAVDPDAVPLDDLFLP